MALVIAGRIVPLDPTDPEAVFKGRVYLGDDGTIDRVTKGNGVLPAGFGNAPVVEVADALVLPGLIDLHNHIGYNTLPLWTEPTQGTPFLHHNSWTGEASYKPAVTWPSAILVRAAPEALLAYVQLRALVGGTTAIQGWPTSNRPLVQVLRNIDDETVGSKNRNLIYTSVITKTPLDLGKMAQAQQQGAGFIYHCAEGQVGSVVAREFADVANAGCLRDTFIGIHCNAISDDDWQRWAKDKAGAIVWSPFSNLWLYGTTTKIDAARKRGIAVCLGSDWGPSGTKHVLGELKVAKLANRKFGYGLDDKDFVAMATSNPGDVLSRCWKRRVGRLVPGGFADVTVFRPNGAENVWSQVVKATERSVMLVVYHGLPRYGDADLMSVAHPTASSPLTVAGVKRLFAIPDPDDATKAWSLKGISEQLDAVRKDPAGALKKADARRRAYAGPLDAPTAPLELVLDMPTGISGIAGALPKHPENVVIPPLPTLVHDKTFFKSIKGRGFHGGLLDGLADFYA
jgi:cytosine/adenosine deaminase-related metal-dependent hydrolase